MILQALLLSNRDALEAHSQGPKLHAGPVRATRGAVVKELSSTLDRRIFKEEGLSSSAIEKRVKVRHPACMLATPYMGAEEAVCSMNLTCNERPQHDGCLSPGKPAHRMVPCTRGRPSTWSMTWRASVSPASST